MPGALIKGTGHFAAATTPADSDTASAYGELDGVVGQITKRLQEMSPPDADPQAVADEIARLIDLPAGARPPARPMIDFHHDGAEEINTTADGTA